MNLRCRFEILSKFGSLRSDLFMTVKRYIKILIIPEFSLEKNIKCYCQEAKNL